MKTSVKTASAADRSHDRKLVFIFEKQALEEQGFQVSISADGMAISGFPADGNYHHKIAEALRDDGFTYGEIEDVLNHTEMVAVWSHLKHAVKRDR